MSILFGLYRHNNSRLHRTSAGIKLGFLLAFSTTLFLVDSVVLLASGFAFIFLLYLSAGFSPLLLCTSMRPVLFFTLCLFIFHLYLATLPEAIAVTLRFVILILAASLVTLTTPSSQMTNCLLFLLSPLRRWLPTEKISLAVSLAIRFIPLMIEISKEVREAQRSRGLEKNFVAIVVPMILRCLQMCDNIALALEARGFDNEHT